MVNTRGDLTIGLLPPAGAEPVATDPDGPTIFIALQDQLGLKLQSKKASIEALVIDHLEKVPTEN